MSHNQKLSWRRWPLAAAFLASVFIFYGITLVSRSHQLQVSIEEQIGLLDELDLIAEELQALGAIHASDLGTDRFEWPGRSKELRSMIATTCLTHAAAPGMDRFQLDLRNALDRADSVHRLAMNADLAGSIRQDHSSVLQIMLQQARRSIDRAAQSIHREGLAVDSRALSAIWYEAQVLVITACMLAVVFAWLVGVSNRLLRESQSHGRELIAAKKELERSNAELRATMLSKEEKEVMLKEIHHRVKNNLQIVKSLIRFQMEQVRDPRMNELFNECVNRVSAMALVHEQTYLSKDLANIDVNTYLSHLTRDLCQAYTIDTELKLDIRINVATLGVDTLIPLGLLINEIISNSLKYAFKDRRQGTIFVHLDGSGPNSLHLRIGDDGVGLRDRSAWKEPKSLGMELIHTLSEQLDTQITLAEGPGTTYELSSLRLERAA